MDSGQPSAASWLSWGSPPHVLTIFITGTQSRTFIMPRRNLWLLGASIAVSLLCAMKVNRYGRVFAFAMDHVRERSVKEVDEQTLFEGALDGMLRELGDEHSTYLPPGYFSKIREDLDQKFGGVGIEVILDPDTQQIAIAAPLPSGPAEKAGIRPRDRIEKIDGKSTKGLSLDAAATLLRGKPGTEVTLTVMHEGEPKPVDIRIVRAEIHDDSVMGETRNPDGTWNFFLEGYDHVGYVRITKFGDRTAEELGTALRGLLNSGMKGLVLDLRYNHGGLLIPAVQACDLLVASGEIVTTRGRGGRVREDFQARGQGTLPDFPMAVLVNEYTASASEIVAACLQDHHRAVVVGQRTYGKGTVQEIIGLPPGFGALKVTAATYWRPSGKDINRPPKTPDAGNGNAHAEPPGDWGVQPDEGCAVTLDAKQLERLNRWRQQHQLRGPKNGNGLKAPVPPKTAKPAEPALLTDVDPQLAKAVQCVEQEITRRRQGLP